MSNKSGVSSQVIALPSGGGALQGIGETFSPDLFTGTGNFSVPLKLPPGRNGFEPQLSLAYSTGNGNGPFGLGWSLSVPAVSRKTSKGVPRYQDGLTGGKSDTFVLSDAEDLVPVSAPTTGVTRFRPRTEGLFARIERVQTSGDDFWRIRSKDGLVSLYGAALPGGDRPAVARPGAPEQSFQWRLTQTTDPFGNQIEYRYLRDAGSEGAHTWDQLYLQQIQYMDFEENGQTRFLVSVTFVYEERPDPFSDYRAGFEMRTRLRCRRIEIRTHAELERLARTVELIYLDERVSAGEMPSDSLPLNGVSLLNQVHVVGHDGVETEHLAPLEFAYSRFEPQRQRFAPLRALNDALPPRSLADDDFEMVGLFGNGLPDLVQMNGAMRFWRNLGNGLFDIPRTLDEVPAGIRLGDPGVQFADMNGNGRADLLALPLQGYFPLSFRGRWSPQGFVPYAHAPAVNFGDNNTRLMDLDGDGVTDALHTGASEFVLFFNDPLQGWGQVESRPRQPLEAFPDLSFSDPRVKLADLTGDNLQDFVLVEQGQIAYWPYLGHGQWGRRILMANSPVFQDPNPLAQGFDPQRVFFGDLDGDGLDDIIYLEGQQLTFWINQGGEGWSNPITIQETPPLTALDGVRIADVLGTGMAGVLWSFDQTAGSESNFQFLDLTGGLKPYLLEEMDNHIGAVTRVQYAPSTQFYLADFEDPDSRWATPLPFPVMVVERVEVVDALSGGKLTTRYSYHHGYWDGAEREFRGFARVEQFDTELFDAFNASGLHSSEIAFEPVAAHAFSPPLLTKRWFHPGPVGDEFAERFEADFASEYWSDDAPALARTEGTVQLLQSLPASHRADAFRSLRGQLLRTELYALDGSEREARPYTVTETQYGIREESPPEGNNQRRRRIFFPHRVAQRTTQWERGDEPFSQFAFTDAYDDYGQPCRQVALAVPRHRDYRVLGMAGEPYLGTVTESEYAQRDDPDQYMVDRLAASATFEILNDGSTSIFDLYRQVQERAARRALFAQSFNYYDGDALTGLSLRELGAFGALVRSESLVLTEEILREAYRNPADLAAPAIPPYLQPAGVTNWPADYPQEFKDSTPALAGYTFADGSDHRTRGYFAQSTRVRFDFQVQDLPPRGLPVTMCDPLGNETTITYDNPYHLLAVQVTDPAGLTIQAGHDYRVLQPFKVTDVNGNRREVTFSPLGLVATTAVMGKVGEQVGDTLEVPGSRIEYDFLAFMNSPANDPQPVAVRTVQRLHHLHDSDVSLPEQNDTIETVEYSDGFGRLIQTRTQAEDVTFGDEVFGSEVLPAHQAVTPGDAVGRMQTSGEPNVVVSGWTTFNNKGQPVEQFEPFFDIGWDYLSRAEAQAEQESEGGRDLFGQRASLFYNPRGQVIRTLNPDGSKQWVIYGVPDDLTNPQRFTPTAWEAFTYDENDLAPLCEGPDGVSLANAAPVHHHFTPSSIVIDSLGRTTKTIARNRDASQNPDHPLLPIQEIRTQSTYDIRGNVLSVTDALDRDAFRYTYDLADQPWHIDSIDAGLRRMVLNVVGNETERRDSKGALSLQAYDRLQRPIRLWAGDDADSPITLRQRMEYGDGGNPAQTNLERVAMRERNLLGQLHRHHDEAGLTTVTAVDLKGNMLDKSRRVIADAPILAAFEGAPANAWQITPFQIDWEPRPQQTLAEREGELLETTAYQTTASYDALNRLKRMQLPQDVEGQRRELRPEYNRAGGLEQVWLDNTLYVERIAYDAKGQRTLIAYGNGVMTRYAYDARTFRLKRLRSERYTNPDDLSYHPGGAALQDFGYDYDLVGNITTIRGRAPESGIPNTPLGMDSLDRIFIYDAVYRLISASGREHATPPPALPWDDFPKSQDVSLTRPYTETYRYDAMGNMLRLAHRAGASGFTRKFTVETANNRLHSMEIGDAEFNYTFDANGNMTTETTSRHFEWNHADQMKAFRTQTDGAEPSVHAHYLYDASGQRVKKLVRKQGGRVEVTHYIDGVFEHHRWGGQLQAGENNHVHVMDDKQRIALVRFGSAHPDDRGLVVQFHLGDHLVSSNLVVDSSGARVSREEFTPYGETSFGNFARKRYRFTGKERDEESGLNYHSARYYASWLGIWLSSDPIGAKGGLNLFTYARVNPLNFVDSSGTSPDTEGNTKQSDPCQPSKPPSPTRRKTGRLRLDFVKSNGDNRFSLPPTTTTTVTRAGQPDSTRTVSWEREARISLKVGGWDRVFTAHLDSESSFTIDNVPTTGVIEIRYIDIITTRVTTDTSTDRTSGHTDFHMIDRDPTDVVTLPSRDLRTPFRGNEFIISISSSTYSPEYGSSVVGTLDASTHTSIDPVTTKGSSVQGQVGLDLKLWKGQVSDTLTVNETSTGRQEQYAATDINYTMHPIPGPEVWTYIFNTPSQPVAYSPREQRIKARQIPWR